MYGTSSHSVSTPMNGMGGELVDGSGTINPAALNTAGGKPLSMDFLPVPPSRTHTGYDPSMLTDVRLLASLPPPPVSAPGAGPRGVKRSRSPDLYVEAPVEHDDDEQNRRKRGRPPKISRPNTTTNPLVASQQTAQTHTPRIPSQTLPPRNDFSPRQASPPSKAPAKALIKALPTVRDHTTDQLGEEGDEYIPKEFDEAGEKKVDALGYPQDGRVYKCRTFRVPKRGEKLFMLATECARVLGYRDSYLLFNKNRSLFKIIATQVEKEDLIQQEVLPYSYRSRQIAIVTAKSMFRQFGSRVIENGRRVRDDYWESKARKQGFTEDDLAGEKRPGAAKARDAAAAEAANNTGLLPALNHGDVVYSTTVETVQQALPPGLAGAPTTSSLAPLPMIHLAPTTDDPRLREYSSVPRPRQDPAGQPYQDRTQPSTTAEILNQASHTADFNKILNTQRAFRFKGLDDFYAKQRDIPVSAPPPQSVDSNPTASQPLHSPQLAPAPGMINATQPQTVISQQSSTMMTAPGSYPQQSHQQPPIAQSPIRLPQNIRADLLHQRTSNPSLPSTTQTPQFSFSQSQQLWGQPPPQPQPSALSTAPHMGIPQYPSSMHHPPQQTPSPLPHHSQQQQQQPPPLSPSPHNQTRQPQSISQSLQIHPQAPQQSTMTSLGYQGGTASPYPNMAGARPMYPSTQGSSQAYLAAPNQQPGITMSMGAGTGLPGWPSQAGGPMQQPGQPQQGQSGSPLGGWSSY
ncbi:Chromatin remodelling complex Rsc7/Swp82 subunit domain containing protein [Elaphomyces granulatus]